MISADWNFIGVEAAKWVVVKTKETDYSSM